jgi:hypothetical protein
MKKSIPIILLFLPCTLTAQVVISNSTKMSQSGTPKIAVVSANTIVNASSFDFSETDLRINLAGPVTGISGNWVSTRIQLNADPDQVIVLNGNLVATKVMNLASGRIQVQEGKISFTGNSNDLSVDANGNSYVIGPFFQVGAGDRYFPVGTSAGYAPVRLPEVQSSGEIGIQAYDADSGLVPDQVDVLDVLPGRYWRISSSEFSSIGSIINISTNGVTIPDDGSPTVVQGDGPGNTAIHLKTSSVNEDNLTSLLPVTSPIVAIGKQEKITVKIHNLITPFQVDDVNDRLYIENIERFSIRKVTLLDRWGNVIRTWGNEYTNGIEYDFATLSPGSYICIAEFSNEGTGTKRISQMITILKTNGSQKVE